MISFTKDKSISEAKVLDTWFKISSAVGLFLLTLIWSTNIRFSITQFYYFNSMMMLENNLRKSK